jgi:isopenicillin N synthase-like dioxygenase
MPKQPYQTNPDCTDEIPVIDLSNPDVAALNHQIYQACSTWGFFQLVNHGIDASLIDSFKGAMSDFFSLPYETKLKLKRNATNARGYFDDELTKRRRDWKECLDVGVPGSRDWNLSDGDEANSCLDGYNQFPSEDECPIFRDVIVKYFDECSRLSDQLAKLLALALGVQEGSEDSKLLDRMMENHTSYLRMNYYPPCTDEDKANEEKINKEQPPPLGISPHRDAGFLTILLQDDDCHSLQVARYEDEDNRDTDADWVTVHPLPGSLTINTGDMAMIWSNGRLRAPLHRVLTDTSKIRYSAPFFYNPGYDEFIAPLSCQREGDGLVSDNKFNNDETSVAISYKPCLWGYFRALRFAGDLTDLGVEIQTSHFKVDSDSDHAEKQMVLMKEVRFDEPFDVGKYRQVLWK